MLFISSAMAYGDCLVTLAQLESLPPDARPYRLLGTTITSRVAQSLRHPLQSLDMLPDKAAFYTIKERGPRAAVADFISMRRSLRQLLQPGDQLAFERRIIRNRLLVPPGCEPIYAPLSGSAYADRKSLVQSLFGTSMDWMPAAAPEQKLRKVLVNPCARYNDRRLSAAMLDNLVEVARLRHWELALLDPCGCSNEYRERVSSYRQQTSLPQAVELMRSSDLYIGPDSFFVHLAYYWRVPCLGFFFPHRLYFLPPGAREVGGYCSFDDATSFSRLIAALDRFCGA